MSDTPTDEKIDPETLNRSEFTGVLAVPQTDGDPTLVFRTPDGPVGVRLSPAEFETMLGKLRAFDNL